MAHPVFIFISTICFTNHKVVFVGLTHYAGHWIAANSCILKIYKTSTTFQSNNWHRSGACYTLPEQSSLLLYNDLVKI